MKKRTPRPPKAADILQRVQMAVKTGNVRDTRHAEEQKADRTITYSEVIEILENGFHEAKKDEFKDEYQSWNYAIRGMTFEGRHLRVPIYFEGDLVMVVTAFDPTIKPD